MGGYIFLRIIAGINDAMSLLWKHVDYAKKHDRTIIFYMQTYNATDLETIIDFSNFPVKVLCGKEHLKDIVYSKIVPDCFEDDPFRQSRNVLDGLHYSPRINGKLPQYDLTKSYPDDELLIFLGFGNHGGAIEVLKNIKFTKSFLSKFREQRLLFTSFVAIHLRATDYPGYNEDSDIQKVDAFVKTHPDVQIYIACDNSKLTEKLCDMYSQLVRPLSYKKIEEKYYSMHYTFGASDPNCVSDALIDILMCACADDFLQSRGGFSTLIAQLRNNPDLIKKLIAYEDEDTVQHEELDGAKEPTTEVEGEEEQSHPNEDTVQPDELDGAKEPTTEDEGAEEQSHPNEDTIQPDESTSLC